MAHPRSEDLFEYTAGHWLVNDAHRREALRLQFDVGELCRLAAESVGRCSDGVRLEIGPKRTPSSVSDCNSTRLLTTMDHEREARGTHVYRRKAIVHPAPFSRQV
ncbi:uncharacterized protein STEHIDRAFT_121267 [Stereum hirsutum FP-91666 SS1]|uniref:uncharacterized protein n=1 Tax=Stereum hirsutum (strain FP-91666) TaxID=721885 RepID=UPI000440CB76|nr:uncharacterized protein STEHIDRAFT_121267 [Stereum hirsutum FP-91666 SS1]EIM87661.1 hypothetical protein STEHIDRAFT_121267 [Stereum hirsutum FP-91666 SS1]